MRERALGVGEKDQSPLHASMKLSKNFTEKVSVQSTVFMRGMFKQQIEKKIFKKKYFKVKLKSLVPA